MQTEAWRLACASEVHAHDCVACQQQLNFERHVDEVVWSAICHNSEGESHVDTARVPMNSSVASL